MTHSRHLTALRIVDPGLWAIHVRTALQQASGRVPLAAAALRVSPRTLYRWIASTDAFNDIPLAPPGIHTAKETK